MSSRPVLLAWLPIAPRSTQNSSPESRSIPSWPTCTTGAVSGFSTACTRVSWRPGVTIQTRPSTAAFFTEAGAVGLSRLQPPWMSRSPASSPLETWTRTISACGTATVSTRVAGFHWGATADPTGTTGAAAGPSTTSMRNGCRSHHGGVAPPSSLGQPCRKVAAATPGSPANAATRDDTSGR